MNPSLHELDDDNQVLRSWPIIGYSIIIGKADTCDIVLDDNYVSQTHAQVSLRPDGEPVWFVEDLGSTNGTRLNDRSVNALFERLRTGDIIHVGRTRLMFHRETRKLIDA